MKRFELRSMHLFTLLTSLAIPSFFVKIKVEIHSLFSNPLKFYITNLLPVKEGSRHQVQRDRTLGRTAGELVIILPFPFTNQLCGLGFHRAVSKKTSKAERAAP